MDGLPPETLEKWRNIAHGYIDSVITGEKIAGQKVMHACQRHLADLERVETDWPYRFDEQKAAQCCEFFQYLKHTDGEYDQKPFELYPWQTFAVWVIFGWVKKETGFRRFSHAFISVGRGNGKSPLAAALLLLVFAFDSPPEPRAECYTAATKTRQASITFDQVKRYVEDSPPLRSYVKSLTHKMSIPETRSTLEKLSGDGKSADGLIPHCVVRDERHEWYGALLRKLDEKLITAMKKRRQPLLIDITTAGNEDSEMWQEDYDYLSLVVDQDTPKIQNDGKFVLIYEMDDEDDELAEETWHKANPMLEHGIVKIDPLREMALEAEWNAQKKAELRRYHCNKFTASANMPITPELWGTGNEELPNLFGKACYHGFDWGWRDDLAAGAYVFPLDWIKQESEDGEEQYKRRYAVICDAWIPAAGNRPIDKEPWRQWIADEYVMRTDSEWTDTGAIYKMLAMRAEMFSIRSVAFDPANAREYGSKATNEFGLQTFEFYQTSAKYNEPIRELILALREGRIIHGGNPLLAWCACNLVTKEDSRNLLSPWKLRAPDKIDPIVAILMALSEAMFNEPDKPSVYETRGPLLI